MQQSAFFSIVQDESYNVCRPFQAAAVLIHAQIQRLPADTCSFGKAAAGDIQPMPEHVKNRRQQKLAEAKKAKE